MELLLQSLRGVHIVLGFIGLAAWWVPIFSRKGGQRHVLFGKVFAACAYVVAGTAIGSSLLRLLDGLTRGRTPTDNPEAFGFSIFLAYLGVVALALTHHAVRTVRTRRNPDAIRTPFHRILALLPILGTVVVAGYAFVYWSRISAVLLALSPVGLLTGAEMLRYMYRRPPEKMAWFYAHMGAMLGAGIAFHTAFLVFGSARFLDLSILGPLNWLPWVLPAAIGIPANRIWESFYRRKFGDLPRRDAPASA